MQVHGTACSHVEVHGTAWSFMQMHGTTWSRVEVHGVSLRYMEVQGMFRAQMHPGATGELDRLGLRTASRQWGTSQDV